MELDQPSARYSTTHHERGSQGWSADPEEGSDGWSADTGHTPEQGHHSEG